MGTLKILVNVFSGVPPAARLPAPVEFTVGELRAMRDALGLASTSGVKWGDPRSMLTAADKLRSLAGACVDLGYGAPQ